MARSYEARSATRHPLVKALERSPSRVVYRLPVAAAARRLYSAAFYVSGFAILLGQDSLLLCAVVEERENPIAD